MDILEKYGLNFWRNGFGKKSFGEMSIWKNINSVKYLFDETTLKYPFDETASAKWVSVKWTSVKSPDTIINNICTYSKCKQR
jgi:hypothetical protein